MSKPRLNETAMSDELGAVASFARRPPAVEPEPDPAPLPSAPVLEQPAARSLPAELPVELASPVPSPMPHLTNAPTNVRTNEATNGRTHQRRKIRHSFDILADQLLSLREIALAREQVFGSKVLLGELVQEALDRFIANERRKE